MNTKQIRAITLAALMVLSVLAVAAPASAAGSTTVSVDPGSAQVNTGGSTTFDIVVDSASGGVGAYNITVDVGSNAQISDANVVVGSSSFTTITTNSDNTSITISTALGDSSNTGSVTIASVTVTGQTAGDAAVDVSVTELGDEQGTPYTVTGTNDATLTVGSSDGGDGGTDGGDGSDGGDGGSGEIPADADATLEDGGTYWVGQQLARSAGVNAGETLELRENTDAETLRQQIPDSNGDGVVVVDTSDLDTGEYFLEDSDNNVLATFEVVTQRYNTLSLGSDTAFNDGSDTNVELTVRSNRGTYTHEVSSDNLDASELQSIFGNVDGTSTTDDGTLLVPGSASQDVNLNFQGIDAGNYTLNFSVTDSTASGSVDINVKSPAPGDASFANQLASTDQGGIAELTVDLENTDTAALQIGSADSGYVANVTLTDSDDDDSSVTLQFNTFTAGRMNPVSASGDDTATLQDQSSLSTLLDQGTYDLTVRSGSDFAADAQAVGTLSVRARSTSGMNIWTAPAGSAGDLEDAEDVAGAIENGTITQDSTIASGDLLVHQLQASGLEGAIAAQDGGSNAARLLNLLETEGISLTIEQTNPAQNQQAKTLSLDGSNTNVIVDDGDTKQVFVIVNTAQLDNVEAGDRFEAEFSITAGDLPDSISEFASSDQSASGTFTIQDRTASLDTNSDGQVVVSAASGQQITGETSLAAGTELTLRARSTTAENPFLKPATATVQEGGTFSATMDFSDANAGSNFTVVVRQGGNALTDQIPGIVTAAEDATVSFSDQRSTDGASVVVDSVKVPQGGFVTIHDSSLLDGDALGSVLGTSSYLDEGTHSNVEVTLDTQLMSSQQLIAMPHKDTNGNQQYDFVTSDGADDGPYTVDGEAVVDSAQVNVGTTTTTTTTTTQPPTTTTTTTTTTTQPPTTTTTTTTEAPTTTTTTEGDSGSGGQPGFGISVAIVALIAAALLALRRQN